MGNARVNQMNYAVLDRLMSINTPAARLYGLLAQMASSGVVVSSKAALAKHLQVSEFSIRRSEAFLEGQGEIVAVKVGGGVYAYAINAEALKSWRDNEKFAVLNTRTLISKDGFNADVERKIKAAAKAQEQRMSQREQSTEQV